MQDVFPIFKRTLFDLINSSLDGCLSGRRNTNSSFSFKLHSMDHLTVLNKLLSGVKLKLTYTTVPVS